MNTNKELEKIFDELKDSAQKVENNELINIIEKLKIEELMQTVLNNNIDISGCTKNDIPCIEQKIKDFKENLKYLRKKDKNR